ncbi:MULTISPECIES: chemotaxis-specific protein-glutamate methyltransferase CheB [Cyanophyceae]|uniref:Protein-glutamate methylesterase/protein-glutamine glutaminase n=1 Tax=Leptolyngbya subtilissima DQ-A4 TaxID=2933933 RepID=A0ABV0JY62_9CYAN|nr:chemotaxis-specific protein-glutamate methyltransferase CheB [Nodosilinea sp. FACHB-141]MBD2112052.1 chemotaxis-specific protein-glutamate methyltransferase CheB [Nodosilinea sp. FACHB-141]
MPSGPIRLLLVDDSPVALVLLQRILREAPDMEVVGVAHNGQEALDMIATVKPTLICTDLHMPKMNGLELTEEVMARCPCPILVISASVQKEDTQTVFRILEAGALDIFPKPRTGLASEYEKTKTELLAKIRVLAGVSVFTHRRRSPAPIVPSGLPLSTTSLARRPRLLALGASTGGPQALLAIMQQLPKTFPVPIVCVQHISNGFLQGLVDWLDNSCALKVTIATAGTVPQPGVVYFPPERHHLEIDVGGRIQLSQGEPVAGHCPSVTVMFQSVAAYYGRSAVGVLLTGMGRDGADGLQTLFQVGGLTIAQDETSCVVFGMPKEAIALGAAQQVLPLSAIAPFLLSQVFVSGLN